MGVCSAGMSSPANRDPSCKRMEKRRKRFGESEDKERTAKDTKIKLCFEKKISDFGIVSVDDKRTLDMLRVVYGSVKEVPKKAKENDRKAANEAGTQLTYGEIDPRGVMMMSRNLRFSDADVLLDIGSGRGRVAVQVFDQYNFSRVIGVEVARERFELCENAVDSYVDYYKEQMGYSVERLREMPKDYGIPKKDVVVVARHNILKDGAHSVGKKRTLEFYRADVGMLRDLIADAKPTVVLMDMAFPSMPANLASVLSTLPNGTRMLTYENLDKKWPETMDFPFSALNGDRFLTSWQPEVGHYFFKWVKKWTPTRKRSLNDDDSKELVHFGIAPHTEVPSPQPRKRVAATVLQSGQLQEA